MRPPCDAMFKWVSQDEAQRIHRAQVAYCLSRPIVKTNAEWKALGLGGKDSNPITAENVLHKAKRSKPERIASDLCVPLVRVLEVIETGDSPGRPMSEEDRATYEAWAARIGGEV